MVIKANAIVEYVLEEMKFRLPEKIIVDSLRWVYIPSLFDTEYKHLKSGVDKYFMHLSNTNSKETIYQLTVEMSAGDATDELLLISAKILLSLQEVAQLDSGFTINIPQPREYEWMARFYSNHGQIVQFLNSL